MTTTAQLDEQYRAAVAKMQTTQTQLGAIVDKADPQRAVLKAELEVLVERVRQLKEAIKIENARRNFSGLTSPLFAAIVARLPADVVAQLEVDALERQTERDRRGQERRAAKAAAASTAAPVARAVAPPATPTAPPVATPPKLPPHARARLRGPAPEVFRALPRAKPSAQRVPLTPSQRSP